jgi:branched-chain amino acid aminotransferase
MSTTTGTNARLAWPEDTAPLPDRPADPRFAAGVAWIDGRIVPVEEATLPLLDWGFLRSDACQETISVWNGQFFRLSDHLDRFERSLGRLRMEPPLPRAAIHQAVHDMVATAGFWRAYVQIIMTRGRPPIGSRDIRLCRSRFQAFCIPFVWIASPEVQQRGMHVHISDRVRISASSVDPMVKHYHWLDFEMGMFDAFDRGAETVVLVDQSGNVTEGPGFNLFARVGDRLLTPRNGMLDGMTRRTTIELCEDLGITVEPADLPAEMLRRADEVFLTTTAGGLIPVTRLDGAAIGDGAPGPVTVRLHREYWQRRNLGWKGEPVTYFQAPPTQAA